MATAGREARSSIVTDQREGEMVESFKYLGIIIDKKLTFNEHANMVYKKTQQCLFLLRKLESFEVSPHVFELVNRGREYLVIQHHNLVWTSYCQIKDKTGPCC